MTFSGTLLILLIAILLDSYIGAPLWRRRWRWHPLIALHRLGAWCAARLDRPERSARAVRFRGGLATTVLLGGVALGGALLEAAATHYSAAWVLTLVIFAALIDQRESVDALRALGRALARHEREAAEDALAALTARDPVHLDSHGMARAGIEALMRRLSRRWMAPLLCAALLGTPGIAGYWLLHALAGDDGRRDFGAAPRKLRALAQWFADRVTGLALAVAALLGGRRGLAGLRAFPGRHWPLAATALALGISLLGPQRYVRGVVMRPWIGRGGRPQVGPNDIAAAARLHTGAVAIVAAAICVICLIGFLQRRL